LLHRKGGSTERAREIEDTPPTGKLRSRPAFTVILSKPFLAAAGAWPAGPGPAEPLEMVLPPSPPLPYALALAAAAAAAAAEDEPGLPGVGVVEREMAAGEAFEDECEDDEPSRGDSFSSAEAGASEWQPRTDRTSE
jgi:hypothetical protein